ncbi:alpha-N-arabinofuranosidase, partial [bacterium]|nr:alpha-N-arabinofuranosidase [bacterium]
SLNNLDPNNAAKVVCELRGSKAKSVTGRILTAADKTAHNTFENPETLKPAVFKTVQLKNNILSTTLPPKSVVVLEIK